MRLEGPKAKKSLTTDVGEAAFNAAFAKCPVVRGLRAVYVRTTPIPKSFNAYRMFANRWADQPNNVLNKDFKLFDNIGDAIANKDNWSYCNYNAGTGFPLDCGKSGSVVGYKFFVLPGNQYYVKVPSNQGLEIYSGDNCPSHVKGHYLFIIYCLARSIKSLKSAYFIVNINHGFT